MVDRNCGKTVARDLGINEDEIAGLFSEANTVLKDAQKANKKPVSVAMKEWAEFKKRDLEFERLVKKRNAAYNTLAKSDMMRVINERFNGDEANGVLAMVWGDGSKTEVSAMSMQKTYYSKWINDVDYKLTQIGEDVVNIVKKAEADDEIVNAMYALRTGADVSEMNPKFVKVAGALNDVFESIRRELNDAGAFIRKRDDWVWKEVHDMRKIKKAGATEDEAYANWWKDVSEGLDFKKTFDKTKEEIDNSEDLTALVNEVSRNWFDALSTGNHMKADLMDTTSVGSSNVAKRLSQRRNIHFKDGVAFHQYQQKYGIGSVIEALNMQIRSSARAMGLMRKLGPNYEQNLDKLVESLGSGATGKVAEQLASPGFKRQLKMARETADGSIDIPGNAILANWAGALRTIQSTSKLGAAVISALTDVVNMAANARVKGRGWTSGYKEALGGLMGNVTHKERVAKHVGAALDVMRGGILDDFHAVDNSFGKMTKMSNMFFRWSLLGPWTNRMRAATVHAEASMLGDMASLSWKDIDVRTQRALSIAEIDEPEWNILSRAVETLEESGESTTILSPSILGDKDLISDDVIVSYLNAKEMPVTAFSTKKARRDLANKLRSYYQDTVDTTVIEPTGRTRAKVLQGTQSGTLVGEIWRSMMQFKSFPLAIISQRLRRDIELRTGKKVSQSFGFEDIKGWGPAMGLFLFQTAAMGYVAMSLKDIAKGREPRDVTDDPLAVTKAALLQGGGLGIYGDFLFGEQNRHGQSFAETMGGPTVGLIGDMLKLKDRAMKGEDVASSALRTFYNNTPFANLFYVRPAVDYFFMERLFNELNPGQAQRRANKLLTNNGQRMLWNQTEGF